MKGPSSGGRFACAIPLLFANAWLSSWSKSIVQILDEQSTGLLAERMEAKGHA